MLPTPLAGLSPAGRAVYEREVVRTRIRQGAAVLHRGARAAGAYLVLDGRLRVFALSPSGAEATYYTLEPGETCVFALNSLFQGLRYPAWVVAEADTEVAVIPGPAFRQLFASEPAVQDLTVRALSTAVFHLMAELEQVHFQRLEHRLVNLLLLRADLEGALHMTQQALAQHLGVTRESVARVLGRMAAAGLVVTGRGVVRIVDDARLADTLAGVETF